MLSWIKKGLWVLALGAITACISDFCQKQTKGFALSKIAPSFSSELVQEIDKDVLSVLDQPFHYLGKGVQCYAFVSADDKYVLKFFRMRRLLPSPWLVKMPLLESYKQEKIKRKSEELFRDFTSYKIAYEQLQEETGLVYVHLNQK